MLSRAAAAASRRSWGATVATQTRRWFAGHSKWSNIQHKKAANDKKRAKIFTKITKEIEHAARSGGGDVPENLLLQSARAKANQFNMPKDKIELAIQRAESNKDKGSGAEIVTYEATGPKGVALVIEALTDSRNRTAKELRHIVTRHNGSLDSKVLWNFERYGDIRVPKELPGERSFEDLFEEVVMIDGVVDVRDDADVSETDYQILVELASSSGVLEYLRSEAKPTIPVTSYAAVYFPGTTVELEEEEDVENFQGILEALDDHDDVQEIFHNAD